MKGNLIGAATYNLRRSYGLGREEIKNRVSYPLNGR